MVWQLVGRDPGRPLAQTSRPELLASDPRQTRSPCSGKRDHRASQVLHERPPEAQTTGATDTRAPEAQSRGRSQTLFYNEARPHQGRYCFGKMPMQTFLDASTIAQEKQIGEQFTAQLEA